MANPKHLQWLLEGSDSWNERRRQQHFDPDLSGANIYEAFKKAGKLNDEGHIPLAGINLVDERDLLLFGRLGSLSRKC